MSHAKGSVAIKRVYDEPAPEDGERVLIDRLWPRGLSKERARVDLWLKDIAPSAELRTWFGHDPAKFDEFRERFEAELAREPGRAALALLRDHAQRGPVTLVFAAHDASHSNAAVLRELLGRAS
ncbi:MAG TPA: DUF488 domain-containing protein [Ktedonobacterales bacterium]|jgi:uncharacterized protein YeaO (DUF488 family)|nr:DUF488 domain-containing protein [Ktedonobacterales bacterium]